MDENLKIVYPKSKTNSKYPNLIITVFCDTYVYLLIIDVLRLQILGKCSLKGDLTTELNSSQSNSMTTGDLVEIYQEDQPEDFYLWLT